MQREIFIRAYLTRRLRTVTVGTGVRYLRLGQR